MDADKSKDWLVEAKANITRYLDHRGDDPITCGEVELKNTIGFAIGLPITEQDLPKDEYELDQLDLENFCFYDRRKESKELIQKIVNSIKREFSLPVDVTVIPTEFWPKNDQSSKDLRLVETPLFRIKGQKFYYFFDISGRFYKGIEDWLKNNQLPEGDLAYPCEGFLKKDAKEDSAEVACSPTPASTSQRKVLKVLDVVTAIGGLSLGVTTMVAGTTIPGAQVLLPAVPFLIGTEVSCVGYGIARSVSKLVDRSQHGQSNNPIEEAEARREMLAIGANALGVSSAAMSMRVASLARSGVKFSYSAGVAINVLNATALTVSGGAILNDTVYMIQNWDKMSFFDKTLNVIAIVYWSRSAFNFKTAKTIIQNSRQNAISQLYDGLSKKQRKFFNKMLNKSGQQRVLEYLNTKSKQWKCKPNEVLKKMTQIQSEMEVELSGCIFDLNCGGLITINDKFSVSFDKLQVMDASQRKTFFNSLKSFESTFEFPISRNLDLSETEKIVEINNLFSNNSILSNVSPIIIKLINEKMKSFLKEKRPKTFEEAIQNIEFVRDKLLNVYNKLYNVYQEMMNNVKNSKDNYEEELEKEENVRNHFGIGDDTSPADFFWNETLNSPNVSVQNLINSWDTLLKEVQLNQIVGVKKINILFDEDDPINKEVAEHLIINQIRLEDLRFGDEATATYQVFRSGLLPKTCIEEANKLIRREDVSVSSRIVDVNGKKIFYFNCQNSSASVMISSEGLVSLTRFTVSTFE